MPRTALALLSLLLISASGRFGEVDVTLRPVSGGPKEGIGSGLIEAPPKRVFRAVMDLDHWDEFMPFVVESDARREPDGSVVSFQRLELPPLIGERHLRIRVRSRTEGRTWKVEWDYVPGSGNIKAQRGAWTLEEAGPGKTRATLRLYTDPGGSAPGWAMDRATGKSLVWIFNGLRQHVRRSRYDDQGD
ncbi:MAG TPA: SRPBCC family protein [Thermoanaerobaculia bacterium]|nr:SRPBCC family protein [Thermoanaerobaculia bacterium]